jgi:hypothetical protein
MVLVVQPDAAGDFGCDFSLPAAAAGTAEPTKRTSTNAITISLATSLFVTSFLPALVLLIRYPIAPRQTFQKRVSLARPNYDRFDTPTARSAQ